MLNRDRTGSAMNRGPMDLGGGFFGPFGGGGLWNGFGHPVGQPSREPLRKAEQKPRRGVFDDLAGELERAGRALTSGAQRSAVASAPDANRPCCGHPESQHNHWRDLDGMREGFYCHGCRAHCAAASRTKEPSTRSAFSGLIDDLEQATRTMSSRDRAPTSPSRGRDTRWSDLADSLTRSARHSAKQPEVEGDVVVIINNDGTVTRVPIDPPSPFETLANELQAACRPAPKARTLADIKADIAARKEALRKREWQAHIREVRGLYADAAERERELRHVAEELEAMVR